MAIIPTDLNARRISYIREQQSRRWIARNANIPVSTLARTELENRPLPAKHRQSLRNIYASQANKRLRGLGMSSRQAFRFMNIDPEKLKLTEARMLDITSRLTSGAVVSIATAKEKRGEFVDTDLIAIEARESILEGLQRSNKTIEQWEGY